jgi:hypothetical protein
MSKRGRFSIVITSSIPARREVRRFLF